MARYLGPVCKLNRRLGVDLELKGRNSNGGTKKKSIPGSKPGRRPKQLSEYGKQLRAKQIIRNYYNLLERQFKKTFKEADRRKGKTGDNLLVLLETRLDNIVYLSNFGVSKRQARQLVNHRHIKVNGKIVDIPSYNVKVGDEIEVIEKLKKHRLILESLKNVSSSPLPKWLELEVDNAKVKVIALPEREDIKVPADELLVVEFYSK